MSNRHKNGNGRKPNGRLAEGNPGRPHGAKDSPPRGFKASVMRLYEELLEERPQDIKAAIKKKLLKADFPHLQMAAHYFDGKPAEVHRLEGDKPLFALILLGERRDPLAPLPPKALPEIAADP